MKNKPTISEYSENKITEIVNEEIKSENTARKEYKI